MLDSSLVRGSRAKNQQFPSLLLEEKVVEPRETG